MIWIDRYKSNAQYWDRKRQERRITFLRSCGLKEEDLGEGGIETDGGNIFYRSRRVAVFDDNFDDEKKRKIELLYTDYGSEISPPDPYQIELVLAFRKVLDKYSIPYQERPSRNYISKAIFKEINFLERLLSEFGS